MRTTNDTIGALLRVLDYLKITVHTPVQIGCGKIMPFSKAVRYCRPGLAIRLPGNSRNLVERHPNGTWYY